jgi:hypothetical protein
MFVSHVREPRQRSAVPAVGRAARRRTVVRVNLAEEPTSCVVLDIDGVLADVRHRLHHLARRPKDWDAFFTAAPADPPLEVGPAFARTAASTHVVVYLTGRPERLRSDTQEWLRRHHLPAGRLLMRPDGQRKPAALVKLEHLHRLRQELRVELLVDDDPTVIDAARTAGFPVRLADWMPRDTPTESGMPQLLYEAQEREGLT